ncbi:MAG: RNA-binding protein [Chitinophagaceae bacterium]
MRVYVSNLALDVRNEELKNYFTPYGVVIAAVIVKDRDTGISRGFGFVEMADAGCARKAISELDQCCVNEKLLDVTEKAPKAGSTSRYRW